ncbi:MAG TPA: hypothetical protein VNA14_04615 [Mycobacteriales bacterium]|nr:hypothetical protein [Mycobacteriales bacterium]
MSVTLHEATIRPAAILPIDAATKIVAALEELDVSRGGVWNATAGVWQRYDQPWDGPAGSRGNAQLVGTIAVIYDRPRRNEITVYKATLTAAGRLQGWTTDKICDDAFAYADLTLKSCPRDTLAQPPTADPFHPELPRQRGLSGLLTTDVRDLLRRRTVPPLEVGERKAL